jgi:hypothetical protein
VIRDYVLLQRHKINGAWYEAGATVSFPEQLGDWNAENGVCERVEGPPAAARKVQAVSVPRPSFVTPARRSPCCGWK